MAEDTQTEDEMNEQRDADQVPTEAPSLTPDKTDAESAPMAPDADVASSEVESAPSAPEASQAKTTVVVDAEDELEDEDEDEDEGEELDLEAARDKIFGSKSKEVVSKLFGVKIVLKEPTIGGALDARADMDAGNQKEGTVRMLVQYVFLPNGQQLFTEEDAAAMLELPFGGDFQKIMNAINGLLGVQPTKADKSPVT